MNPPVFISPSVIFICFYFFPLKTEKMKSSVSLTLQFSQFKTQCPLYLYSSPPLVLTSKKMYSRHWKKKKPEKLNQMSLLQ